MTSTVMNKKNNFNNNNNIKKNSLYSLFMFNISHKWRWKQKKETYLFKFNQIKPDYLLWRMSGAENKGADYTWLKHAWA